MEFLPDDEVFANAPLGHVALSRYRHGSETWAGVCNRVASGNAQYIADHVGGDKQVESEEYGSFLRMLYNMKFIMGGRHLFMTGFSDSPPMNCYRAGWGTYRDHFTFLFDALLLGGGVGSNYSAEYTRQGDISRIPNLYVVCRKSHPDYAEMESNLTPARSIPVLGAHDIRLPDSREGWVEAAGTLFDGHKNVVVDVSDIRGRGEPIGGFGGTASGPAPLVEALRQTERILKENNDHVLTGVNSMRIDHALACAVVSGNVRRSARMSMMHWGDPEIFDFISCKDDKSQHWTTNISVEIDGEFLDQMGREGSHASRVYGLACDRMLEHGEPGFYNSELASDGECGDVRSTNPCGEVPLEDWEACNLGSLNLARLRDDDEVAEAAGILARALYRATFAPFSDPKTTAVVRRNRRIGLGIMGLTEWAARKGIRWSELPMSHEAGNLMRMIYDAAADAVDEYAEFLECPPPIKVTAIAPNGTISLLAGVTAGLNPVQHHYFLRRVRYASGAPELRQYRSSQIEDDVASPDTKVVTTYHVDPTVLEFGEDIVEDATQISVEAKLAVQAWATKTFADNAISFTITVGEDEIDPGEFKYLLAQYLPMLKGTTIFKAASRPQSPIEAITKEEFEARGGTVSQDDELCKVGGCPVA